MASRKFRFVSPGVFLREIDNSQRPRTPEGIGPVIIGRTRKGPAMKPYKIRSTEEFERVFGISMPGNQGEDPWRDGTGLLAESYLPYASKAYLSADIDSPVTVIRLAGVAGDNAVADGDGEPGWTAGNAWGLFLMKNDSAQATANLELGAVFYGVTGSDFGIKLKGTHTSASSGTSTLANAAIKPSNNGKFTVQLSSSAGTKEVKFAFNEMRKDFNTNPVMTNDRISSEVSGTLAHHYWLGETFEEVYHKIDSNSQNIAAVAIQLTDEMEDFKSLNHGLTSARSGWVFGNDTSDSSTYNPDNMQRLFRIISLQDGSDASRDLIVAIEDIKPARTGAVDRFGTFSVVVKHISSTRLVTVERFDGCNLNPDSSNYIARKIGDVYMEWDPIQKRNKTYGSNVNISEFIRIEMNSEIENQGGPINVETVPFGFYGPVVPKTEERAVALSGAAAEIMTLRIDEDATLVDSLDGGTITLIQENGAAANATKVFTLDNTVTAASVSGTPLTIGLAGLAHTPQDVAPVIKAKLEAHGGVLGDITFAVSSNGSGTETITITQGTAGDVVTVASDNSLMVAGTTTSGSDGEYLVTPSFSTWATGSPSLSGAVSSSATVNLVFPSVPNVTTGSAESGETSGHMFGATPFEQTWKSGSGEENLNKVNKGFVDFTRIMSDYGTLLTDQLAGTAGADSEVSYKVSLDDVIMTPPTGTDASEITGPGNVQIIKWVSGSRAAGNSWSSKADVSASIKLRTMLDIVGGFHMPLIGGNDGVDITEADPFNMAVVGADATTANSYAYASIDRAIEMVRDPELIEHNLATMPGVTNTSLTTKLIRVCEARADSLAIIDLPDVYVPPFQAKCSTFKHRVDGTTPETSAENLVARQINSSYGATYYPWVKIKDETFSRDVWVPPSVVALGVMAYTEERDDVWFAPAGFNRGGLNTGNAGLPVLQASEQLLSKDRDTLYAANINPVAQFVSEGLVIFGQKTLQSTETALDRINVRRLLIFVKKEVSRISNSLLFEQNVQATWARFTNRVVPFLERVKTRFGLSDFKVVLDGTTTTPDLIDRNVMYAKVFLKPARSIEFIAVDFVITNTGASFDD